MTNMESRPRQVKATTKQGSLKEMSTKARLLRQYAGIFPDNIVEFASTILKRHKAQKNMAR